MTAPAPVDRPCFAMFRHADLPLARVPRPPHYRLLSDLEHATVPTFIVTLIDRSSVPFLHTKTVIPPSSLAWCSSTHSVSLLASTSGVETEAEDEDEDEGAAANLFRSLAGLLLANLAWPVCCSLSLFLSGTSWRCQRPLQY